ncbi:TPA: hypothetical protein DHW51_20185, partial [Candidatus Poribacteria bacterium]|nr:hypothetical protein [Candidatus Poribacteria bacterium]
VELEKSKRHAERYYLGTNRFNETDRLKSILNNQEQEEQFRQNLKQDYQKTLKEFNPKVAEVLKEHGFDHVAVDSLEFKQYYWNCLFGELIMNNQKGVLRLITVMLLFVCMWIDGCQNKSKMDY